MARLQWKCGSLQSCVAATSSLTLFFSRNLALPPADNRYCPPLRAELSTRDSGVLCCLETRSFTRSCNTADDSVLISGLLAFADFGKEKRLEFVCYERGLHDRGCILDL